MEYNVGDYVCVNIKGHTPWGWFIAQAIKHFTHSEYDHAFVIVGADGTIVEAKPTGAEVSNITEYAGMDMKFYTYPIPGKMRKAIADNARGFVGVKYGFLDIVYLGLTANGLKFKWLLKKVLREDRMICSQLVATSGVKAGTRLWLCGKADPQLVTPADLAKLADQYTLESSHAYIREEAN